MNTSPNLLKKCLFKKSIAGWDSFFFSKEYLPVVGILRILYSILFIVNILFLAPYLPLWFAEDGVITKATSLKNNNGFLLHIFLFLPDTHATLWLAYGLLLTHAILLLIGFYPRLQAIAAFFWFNQFINRNMLIFDAEDQVFRLLLFFLIFFPLTDYASIHSRKNREEKPKNEIWPLRLMQIQMSIIFLATFWEKLYGQTWIDGTVLYYVSRLDDLFGKFPLPSFIFEYMILVKLMTWGTLVVELLVPITIWFKKTRRLALTSAILFHLSVDYTMNLNLFHPIMIVGWLSFLTNDDINAIKRLKRGQSPFSRITDADK